VRKVHKFMKKIGIWLLVLIPYLVCGGKQEDELKRELISTGTWVFLVQNYIASHESWWTVMMHSSFIKNNVSTQLPSPRELMISSSLFKLTLSIQPELSLPLNKHNISELLTLNLRSLLVTFNQNVLEIRFRSM